MKYLALLHTLRRVRTSELPSPQVIRIEGGIDPKELAARRLAAGNKPGGADLHSQHRDLARMHALARTHLKPSQKG
jgi:hypothetical protein